MSGGGSSVSFDRPAAPLSGPGGPDNCAGVSIPTTLASPNALALSTVVAEELLEITINGTTKALEVINSSGQICGSIVVEPTRLRKCIESGVSFHARVLSVVGPECKVVVQNA